MGKIIKISAAGIACIKESEGCKLKAYRDSGGIWTIGIGTTRYPDGSRVKEGDTCTEAQAEAYLLRDVAGACKDVDDLTRDDLSQAQFDALVSLVYNIGRGNYSVSTVRRLINAYDIPPSIHNAWLMWDKVHGQQVAGLYSRREREFGLFISK